MNINNIVHLTDEIQAIAQRQQATYQAVMSTIQIFPVASVMEPLRAELQRIVEVTSTIRIPPIVIDRSSLLRLNELSSVLVLQASQCFAHQKEFLASTTLLSHRYAQLIESWSTLPQYETSSASIYIGRPAIEMWNHAQCMRVIAQSPTPPEEESDTLPLLPENTTKVERWLAQKDAQLCTMWKGAYEASVSTNPDRSRHVMVSLRTLLEQILKLFAPDDEVRAWSSDPKYYEGKKVLRKGQLTYICRQIQHPSLTRFLEADIDASLSLASTLNQLHEPSMALSEQELRFVLNRFEALVLLLIDIDTWQ